jgi:hypothetical protein
MSHLMSEHFPSPLVNDHRILSAPEKDLLARMMHHAKQLSLTDPSLGAAVERAMAQAVGETLMQRSFAVLGSEVLAKISAEQAAGSAEPTIARNPKPTPQPPPAMIRELGRSVQAATAEAGWAHEPILAKNNPKPTPQPPPAVVRRSTFADAGVTGVIEAGPTSSETGPAFQAAEVVVLDEFLAPQELAELLQFALAREAEFEISEVISPGINASVIDHESRRSRVLMSMGKHADIIVDRILRCLPGVLERFGIPPFTVSRTEAQITASHHGDFFREHSDTGTGEIGSRALTFVYFFHREPKAFRGGELRVYDARMENGEYVSLPTGKTIVPGQNQVVFFPSSLLHEIAPVECPNGAFADSRFTVNGWLHR